MKQSLVIFIFLSFFSIQPSLAYEIQPYRQKVNTQQPSALNLIFCHLNYQQEDELDEDIDLLSSSLSSTAPFNEFTDSISIWKIHLSKEEADAIFKPISGCPSVKVLKDFIDNISSQLKSEFKLIIIDAQGSSSCAELSSIDKSSLIILGKAPPDTKTTKALPEASCMN